MFLSSLNNISSSIKPVGYISLLLSLILSTSIYILYIVKKSEMFLTQSKLLIASTPYVFIMIVGLIKNPSGLSTFLQILLLFGLMVAFSVIKWEFNEFKILGTITIVFVLIQTIIWSIQGFPKFFESIYGLSNLVGSYMLYCIIILFLVNSNSKVKYIYSIGIVLSFILILASETRSVLIALLFFAFTYYAWNLIIKSKLSFIVYFLIMNILTLSILFIYPKVPSFKYFNEFESFMIANTGKSIMSGRQVIWDALQKKAVEFPLFGHGTGIQNHQISALDQSSHNLYLQVVIQNGYLGLASFMFLLFSVWLIFWNGRRNKNVRIVASALIATIIYQSFEITLIQNALSIGIIQWAIIGIGISSCIYQKECSVLNLR